MSDTDESPPPPPRASGNDHLATSQTSIPRPPFLNEHYAGNGLVLLPDDGPRTGSASSADEVVQSVLDIAAEQSSQHALDHSTFEGRGYVLGESDSQSEVVPGSVSRRMTIWSNGFSFDSGKFIRRDPSDADQLETLRLLQVGRAPLHWLDVSPGQEVRLELIDNRPHAYADDLPGPDYFVGNGNRLADNSEASGLQSLAPRSSTGPGRPSLTPGIPVVRIRLVLPDSSHVVEFNRSHTMIDIHNYASSVYTGPHSLVLSPTETLASDDTQIGDHPTLRSGGVVRLMPL